jgi:zinc protease
MKSPMASSHLGCESRRSEIAMIPHTTKRSIPRVAHSGPLRLLALAATALTLTALATATVHGQENSTPLSKVERLNRAPVSKEVLRVQLPRPVVAKLPNGLTLLLLEDHKLPTVTFIMWIRPGQLADPPGLPGLASFTADMLREGTERRSSLAIAAEADSLGATLGANARFGASYSVANAAGLAESAPQLLDLLSDIVLHPAFPPAELASYKQREIAALEQRLANPVFLGQRTFRQVLYGDGPLAMASPTRDSIAQVTPEDLKRFHDQHYRPGNTILGAIGDFKAGDMRGLIEKYFAAWSGAAEPPISLATKGGEPQPAAITLVDRPRSVQTYIIGGTRGIRRTDPEYYSLQVMNQILGGGPQARLFLDLREEHGYTYGAYSNFNAEIYPGDWLAAAAVRTPVTDGSMTQFVYQFKRISSEAVPQSELEDARHAIVASFALSLEQPARLLDNWMTVQYYGLPADYWDQYPDRIAAVDAAAVQTAARKFVDLAHIQWICVGDRRQIQETLAKYGPVTVVDAEGKAEK